MVTRQLSLVPSSAFNITAYSTTRGIPFLLLQVFYHLKYLSRSLSIQSINPCSVCRWVWFGRVGMVWTTCCANRWTWTSSGAGWAGRQTADHIGFTGYTTDPKVTGYTAILGVTRYTAHPRGPRVHSGS